MFSYHNEIKLEINSAKIFEKPSISGKPASFYINPRVNEKSKEKLKARHNDTHM
jgi:hypothetical protein